MTYLSKLVIENFKAIRKSGTLFMRPLTVFIGNNGSGKSSVIEALETYQKIVLEGVDAAMQPFLGFEYVRHLEARGRLTQAAIEDPGRQVSPVIFRIAVHDRSAVPVHLDMQINSRAGDNVLYIQHEEVRRGREHFLRDPIDAAQTVGEGRSMVFRHPALTDLLEDVRRWQFVFLEPQAMGRPRAQRRSGGKILLNRDGSNLAEYLLDIRDRNQTVFEEIVEAMQFILPYAADVRPASAMGLERQVFLEMIEREMRIPGWMLSTGTLRALALIALLRDPDPPPLILIEELENGLDPRTIGLIVEEIRLATSSKRTQVVATTHSPYLLDSLDVDDLIVVERDENGYPRFYRPKANRDLDAWRKRFTPGRLYTMGLLRQRIAQPTGEDLSPETPEGGWG